MASTQCSECDEEIEIAGRARLGQKIICGHCGAQLEVVATEPLELDMAQEEEDNWEDDPDDDDEDNDDFDEVDDLELEDAYEDDDFDDLDDFDDDDDSLDDDEDDGWK